ncbi:MAG TPA: prephenate dehydrogenase [Anaerolineae bacterium]|nr:prephenate dehydrogenase [Anaerolineae bacterium]
MKTVVSILGIGLIGGSLAAALKQQSASYEIVGYNRRAPAIDEALKRGIIDRAAESIEEAASVADVIFVAVPVKQIPNYAVRAANSAKRDAIITDVGSTKANITAEVEPHIPEGVHFIGGHPMAGSEHTGVTAANPSLFKNAHYLLTPTSKTDMAAYKRLHSMLTSIGANVLAIDPQKHDRAVAVISHLPHMLAAVLMNLASSEAHDTENILMLAAGGFKDTTRIAAGSPQMWIDICLDNRDAIIYSIEKMNDMLESLSHAIGEEDKDRIRDVLERAQSARLNLPSILGKEIGRLYELYIPVTDRPGVISDITLAVGQIGINIEDIEILHATESSGTMRLTIPEKENADRAAKALTERGYEVDLRTVE